MKKRLILVITTILLTIISIFVGVANVQFIALLRMDQLAWFIVIQSRIPRTLAILLTATSLSISGLILQTISKNKFVSPGIIGVTDSAQLGILLSYLWFGSLALTFKLFFAFLFAVMGSYIFLWLLKKVPLKQTIYVPLLGMMFASVIGGITSFIAFSFNAQQWIQTWGLASFSTSIAGTYELLYVVVIPLLLSYIYMVQFNIIGLGEDFAKNLGIRYEKVMMIGLWIVAINTAATFVVVGTIPFIGLVIPNLVSIYFGDNTKKNAIDVALFGSAFVLLGDIISRIIVFPYEIPIGLTLGVIGSMIFLFLIYRRVNHVL